MPANPIAAPLPLSILRQAVRRLRRAPGYALTVVAVLALGIGAVTAIFSVVYGVLIKPYGFEGRGQLVAIHESVREYADVSPLLPVNYRHFLNLEQNAPALAAAAVSRPGAYSAGTPGGHPVSLAGLNVSSDFFRTLGVEPAQGRGFRSGEFTAGRDAVAMLTAASWQRFFPGQSFTPGKTLRIDGKPVTVTGVLPPSFHFPAISVMPGTQVNDTKPLSIFTPLVLRPNDTEDLDGDYNYVAIGRLRPGISLQAAQAQFNGLERALALDNHLLSHFTTVVEPFSEAVTGGISRSLVLLLLAVGGVLLIGCVNLANLQLARSVGLMPEHALRTALGASRTRMILESLTENLLLAAAGVLFALPLAEAGLRLFLRLAPSTLPRLNEVALNLPIFGAALMLSLITSLLCGFLPAWRAGTVDPAKAMQTGNRGTGETRNAKRVRTGLLITEIACSVTLLSVTGLLVQSFSKLITSSRALGSQPVTMAEAGLYTPEYQNGGFTADGTDAPSRARSAFIEASLDKLRALPGVAEASATSELPLTGEVEVDSIRRPDHPVPNGQAPQANMRRIAPNYFSTLRIPILAGRAFTAADRDHTRVVILSASAAHAAFPGENPLGHLIEKWDRTYTVVGVAADTRLNDPRHDTLFFYMPFWDYPPFSPVFLLRGRSPSAAEIQRAIWSVDREIAIPTILPLQAQTAESLAVERFQTLLIGAFGFAGLLLAMLGIYGSSAYSVNRRMREWGLRMALGSPRSALIRQVLAEAARPLLAALLAGTLGAIAAERWLHALLYEASGGSLLAALAPALVLLPACALAAAYPAARRAAQADPAEVLRLE